MNTVTVNTTVDILAGGALYDAFQNAVRTFPGDDDSAHAQAEARFDWLLNYNAATLMGKPIMDNAPLLDLYDDDALTLPFFACLNSFSAWNDGGDQEFSDACNAFDAAIQAKVNTLLA